MDNLPDRIKSQNMALLSLSRSRALFDADFTKAMQSITEAAARTLEVERASVWLFDDSQSILNCVDLYRTSTDAHAIEPNLESAEYPGYFAALREERMIAAHDVGKDPRVSELGPRYLDRLDISSMLDAPVRWRGKMVGVICNEHTGQAREWQIDEQYFSGCLADFVTILLEARESTKLKHALRFERDLQSRIYSLSSYFINLSVDDIEKGIKAVLGSVGELAHAERITLLQFEEERTKLRAAFRWAGARAKRGPHPLEGEIVMRFPWLSTRIFRDSTVEFESLRSLPEEAAAERRAFERDSISSGLYIPLSSREGLHAVLALDTIGNSTVWHSRCVNALRLGGETVLNALLYRRDRSKLAEAGNFYRTVLESMIESVVIADLDGRIHFISDGSMEIFGLSPGQIVEIDHMDELLGGKLLDVDELRSKGKLEYLEWEHVKDGNRRSLAISAKLLGMDGKERVLYTCRDVTRQKDLEEQLLRAQRMEIIGQITSSLMHDFNNLLTPVIGYSRLLEKEFPEGSKQRRYASLIQNGAAIGQSVIRQLMSFGRKGSCEEIDFDLDELIEEAIQLLDFSIPSNIRIERDIRVHPARIRANPTEIYQVFMNLCINAAHAMGGNDGTLSIGLDRADEKSETAMARLPEGDYYVLSVRDTGSGIPEDFRNRIFEPFFTTKDEGIGTGLGLPAAKACIEHLGGAIEFDSEVDRGTVFRVYLPASTEGIGDSPPPDGERAGAVPNGRAPV